MVKKNHKLATLKFYRFFTPNFFPPHILAYFFLFAENRGKKNPAATTGRMFRGVFNV